MRRLFLIPALVLLTSGASASPGMLASHLGTIAVPSDRLQVQWGAPQPSEADAAVRMNRLENQLRQLNGTIEQLQNQIRVMQEQQRRFQQDTEFRFQEMQPQQRAPQPRPQPRGEAPQPTPGRDVAQEPRDGVVVGRAGTGAPPAALGQTRSSGETGGQPLVLTPPGAAPADSSSVVASTGGGAGGGQRLPPVASPAAVNPSVSAQREEYDIAYGYMLRGDYELAERAFQEYLRDHPSARNAGDAMYWLGESFYLRRQWRPAAEHFLRASTEHPQSSKAPESLLRLGMSLRQMGQREPACATFAEVTRRYPRASSAVRQRVQTEQRNATC